VRNSSRTLSRLPASHAIQPGRRKTTSIEIGSPGASATCGHSLPPFSASGIGRPSGPIAFTLSRVPAVRGSSTRATTRKPAR
jgi:hypothetical protein